MVNNKKIIVILPAYNAEKTIKMTIDAIPRDSVDEIMVVDDGSRDRTREITRSLGVKLFVHEKNRGYGGSQKTAYTEALKAGADIVVMVHSDFQYDPTLVPQMIRPIIEGQADACFGSRMAIKRNALKGGMPLWRFIPNIILTFIEDAVVGLGLSEYHTGYRAFSREVLTTVPFLKNSDNYVFDTEMIVALRIGRFRVAEIPIPTRYSEISSSPNFRKSVEYGLMTLAVMLKYILHQTHFKRYPAFVMNPRS